jgi:hypothetical protein
MFGVRRSGVVMNDDLRESLALHFGEFFGGGGHYGVGGGGVALLRLGFGHCGCGWWIGLPDLQLPRRMDDVGREVGCGQPAYVYT